MLRQSAPMPVPNIEIISPGAISPPAHSWLRSLCRRLLSRGIPRPVAPRLVTPSHPARRAIIHQNACAFNLQLNGCECSAVVRQYT